MLKDKIILVPFEGFLIHILFSPKVTLNRFYVTLSDSTGERINHNSTTLDNLFFELKNRADWDKETKRANDYKMPSVINQIGVGADKTKFTEVSGNATQGTAPMSDYFKEQLGEPNAAPLSEENVNPPPFDKTDITPQTFIVNKLLEGAQDGIHASRTFAQGGSSLYIKAHRCDTCSGTGDSNEATRLRMIFNQEIKYRLTQRDVDALVNSGCLLGMTHTLHGNKRVLNPVARVPTPEEVMFLATKDKTLLSNRAIDVIIKSRLKFFNVPSECSACNGTSQTYC